MTTAIVEPALRSTYHLAGADAQRLRRLTRASGLDAENVLSRLAIIRSMSVGMDGPYRDFQPSQAGRTKEIKGTVLLGRPPQAALMLALLARVHDGDFVEPRAALTWHWARGLKLLEDDAEGGDIILAIARQLADGATDEDARSRRVRRSGLGGSVRDEVAAAVARRFPRWSTEVCRLVAMAARLDPDQVDAVAERLAVDAERMAPGEGIGEKVAIRVLKSWGINRLGLSAIDRGALGQLLADGQVEPDHPSLVFLRALGLVGHSNRVVKLTAQGRRLGQEALHL